MAVYVNLEYTVSSHVLAVSCNISSFALLTKTHSVSLKKERNLINNELKHCLRLISEHPISKFSLGDGKVGGEGMLPTT